MITGRTSLQTVSSGMGTTGRTVRWNLEFLQRSHGAILMRWPTHDASAVLRKKFPTSRRSAPSALRLKEGDEVSSLLLLLDASEHHLRPGDVLLGIYQVLEHVLVRPHDPRVLVGLGECETLAGARGAAHDAPQGWALLCVATLLHGVALSTLGLEELSPLLHVTCRHFHVWLGNHHDCRWRSGSEAQWGSKNL